MQLPIRPMRYNNLRVYQTRKRSPARNKRRSKLAMSIETYSKEAQSTSCVSPAECWAQNSGIDGGSSEAEKPDTYMIGTWILVSKDTLNALSQGMHWHREKRKYPPCTGKRYQITPFPNSTKLSNRITTSATKWRRGKLRGTQSNQTCWLFLTGGRGRTMAEDAAYRSRLCGASFVSMANCQLSTDLQGSP
ncbi:uncharacterized protein BDV14DRAFT_115888 [Aspergillus stella-maris]|uniref:uncharacterized protein n=1 Tax=Aspergillus stella-maris TaxID=1810926 RepID=UPI003CCCBB44